MPSRASTSLLRNRQGNINSIVFYMCQCPHGLVPHCYAFEAGVDATVRGVSMPSRASTSLLLRKVMKNIKDFNECQCPHGLVPHCYR